MISSNKFWGSVFIVGIFTLFTLLYAYFSTSYDKTEASTVQKNSNGNVIVVIDDKAFKPQVAKIAIGTTVEWINKGSDGHRITFGLNATLENLSNVDQVLNSGETLTFKFETPGSFNYYDKNFGLTGVVEVK